MMRERLRPLFSVRFLKFCAVGLSGVFVNLIALGLLSDVLQLQVNLASALAIEISINTNFLINELWTFRDRRLVDKRGTTRWAKFHLVSLVGAAIQWSVFIAMNHLWLVGFMTGDQGSAHTPPSGGWFEQHVLQPIVSPPDVGHFKYLSQLCGIGAATFWNYFANFYWTWKLKRPAGDPEESHG